MALDFPSSPVNGQVYDNFIYDSTKGTWKSLSAGASPSILTNPTINNAVITATATNATTVPLTVKGAASQTANLQEWKNSSGTLLSSINSSGQLTTDKLNNTGFDLTLGSGDQVSRGNSGSSRALVKINNSKLFINYAGDFTGGTVVDSSLSVSGISTAPNQTYFLAYGNSVGNVTYNAGTVLQFQNIRRQVGSSYNTSNGRFTAPVAGNYFLWFEAFNNGGQHRVSLRVNGGAGVFGQGMQNSGTNFHQAGVTYLAAGDYVDVRTAYDGTVVYSSDNHLEFGGVLLS